MPYNFIMPHSSDNMPCIEKVYVDKTPECERTHILLQKTLFLIIINR